MRFYYGMNGEYEVEFPTKEMISQLMIDQMSATLGASNPKKVYIFWIVFSDKRYRQRIYINIYAALEEYLKWIERLSSSPDNLLALVECNLTEPHTNSIVIGNLGGVDLWVDDTKILYRFTTVSLSVKERVNLLYFVGGAIFLDLSEDLTPVTPVCTNMLRASGVDVDNMDQSVLKEKCIKLYYDFKVFINDITTNHYMPLDLNNAKAWLDKHIKEG